MLRGLSSVVGQANITAVVNTGDDMVLHGLYVSPDIDTVTYTLGGASNHETGWGLAGESWAVMDAFRAFEVADGGNRLTWFNLGDRDLATHLFRTGRLAGGATLSQVTAEVARRFGVQARLLPMTDSRVETRVTIALGEEVRNFGGLATALADEEPGVRQPVNAAEQAEDGPGPGRGRVPGVLRRVPPQRRREAGPVLRRRPGPAGAWRPGRHSGR